MKLRPLIEKYLTKLYASFKKKSISVENGKRSKTIRIGEKILRRAITPKRVIKTNRGKRISLGVTKVACEVVVEKFQKTTKREEPKDAIGVSKQQQKSARKCCRVERGFLGGGV